MIPNLRDSMMNIKKLQESNNVYNFKSLFILTNCRGDCGRFWRIKKHTTNKTTVSIHQATSHTLARVYRAPAVAQSYD